MLALAAIVTVAELPLGLSTAPPSSWYSTRATPEAASLPPTVTVCVPARQPPETAVVSVGATVSMRTVSVRHGPALPARSTTRVASAWTPSPATVALAPVCGVPSTVHSKWSTPLVASEPEREIVVPVARQALETAGVVSAGTTVSIGSVVVAHADQVPATSRTRWASVRAAPSPGTAIAVPGAAVRTAPPLIRYSNESAPEPASEAASVTSTGEEAYQPASPSGAGGAVASTGAVASIESVSAVHGDQLPAASETRWASTCVPSPPTATASPAAAVTAGPPSSVYSNAATPDSASVALKVTVTGSPEYQPPAPAAGSAVVSAGGVVSSARAGAAANASASSAQASERGNDRGRRVMNMTAPGNRPPSGVLDRRYGPRVTVRDVTTWYLELASPEALRPAPEPREGLEVRRAAVPSPELSRWLYTAVGADWWWVDRLGWDWARWHAYLARPQVETWIAYEHGTPAGYAELVAADGDVELASFGLLPAFIGRGIGPRLLDAALRRAWRMTPAAGPRVGAHVLARRPGGAAHLRGARDAPLPRGARAGDAPRRPAGAVAGRQPS